MKRPKRENYPNGIYGDISYNDRLERYTSYLENRLKERDNALHKQVFCKCSPLEANFTFDDLPCDWCTNCGRKTKF